MSGVEIVVPWRGGCEHRARGLEWIRGRYLAEHPDWIFTLAETAAGPWIKAAAVTPAVERSNADVLVVADADVWTEGIGDAAAAVLDGAPWAVPHGMVHRLDEAGTAAVLAGAHWEDEPLAERMYRGLIGGGIVVARRDALSEVPLDPRFVGWGQEDCAWALALDRLLGSPWRGEEPMVHLWHPPQERLTRRRGSRESWQLFRDYHAAHQAGPAAMRRLIEEATACPSPVS